ncbi:hypothetical protein LY78DRAFT_118768 [Colletotrichum sublineola]|uniref:Uncharacterized protein n=1 Tax=Colletotrichum sublineola TaxID=1173701 RepID=A0A066XLJ9_COLSU|nr:hypothetical protein LY78DRAFT_118768 [Colletotrichum sublineola]KDN69777.1 hypothetical protein CSUB01_11402 [Colletotrichum sublineola]
MIYTSMFEGTGVARETRITPPPDPKPEPEPELDARLRIVTPPPVAAVFMAAPAEICSRGVDNSFSYPQQQQSEPRPTLPQDFFSLPQRPRLHPPLPI